MPIKESAKKYVRVTERKTAINKKIKQAFRQAIKKTLALAKTNQEEARKSYVEVQKALDKAAKNGIIKKNTASRKKSRLVKILKKATATK